MAELLRITQSGYHEQITCKGRYEDRHTDGVVIDAPGQMVVIGAFYVSLVRVPLIVLRVGRLIIGDYAPRRFWGDAVNIRCSHVYIDRHRPHNILQRFRYKEYHQDILGQIYATRENGWKPDPCGHIRHIHINEVDVQSGLEDVNGFMLSERCRYSDIHIGIRRVNVAIEAPYWFSANHLQDSVIGGQDCSVWSLSGQYKPGIRIQNVKAARYHNHNAVLWNTPHLDGQALDHGVCCHG